jgi:D-3-phosphoglycerate dehydrogenase
MAGGKMKALVTAKIAEEYMEDLKEITTEQVFTGRGYTGYKLTTEEMIELVGDIDIIIGGIEQVNAAVMDAGKNLKIIACCRNEAFASVDIEAATERGIPVLSSVGRNAISVAEFTIGILLACCKNISTTDYLLRHTDQLAGKIYGDKTEEENSTRIKPPSFWSTDPTGPSALYGNYPELLGKKFGQIGYGTIGREVAKRALGFGVNLLICDPFVKLEEIAGLNARVVDLPTLMQESDFISINCNVTPSTVGLVSKEMLSLMKPTAFIVNTARAPVMDYDALYELLRDKKIGGAAMDVFPEEPIAKGDKLLSLDNVVLTPHIAGQSREIPRHQSRIILKNIKMLLEGQRPDTICNPQVLDQWFMENRDLLIL